MKHACLVLLALSCGACTSFENPIVAEGGPSLDAALIGHWLGESEDGKLEIEIRASDEGGVAILEGNEEGKEPQSEEMTVVTAKLESRSFISLQPRDGKQKSWLLYGYEFAAPDRLLVHYANEKFWLDAVRNKIVTGTIEKGSVGEYAAVTASSEEMRAVVLGYGAVLFKDEVAFELRRRSPD